MILVLDNYDSFTYNLVQYLGQTGAETRVFRNDAIALEEIRAMRPGGILLSPGPCTPTESGVCLDVARAALGGEPGFDVPLLGVCLGFQALVHVAGGTIRRAGQVRHGKASPVGHDGRGVFAGLPNPLSAIRYHSLVADWGDWPEAFEITAESLDDGEIMALRHRSLPVEGVLFHPESILTEGGFELVANFARGVEDARALAA